MPTLYLAPMAGATNTVFRKICRSLGADILTSEMVSAEGILHLNARTRHYIEFDEIERPFGIQLFGANPEKLAEAAHLVIAEAAPDFLDFNVGCPVSKVVGKNGGSSLLRNHALLEDCVRSLVQAAGALPVTAKIRTGWDSASINATETARLLEGCGIVRITIHGRTRSQGYSGEADWQTIARVVESVKIPVVGNGDIRSAADAIERHSESGVEGLMIGRAAMTNPWIFSEIRTALAGHKYEPPTREAHIALIIEHCRGEILWRGDERAAISAMRSRLMAYARGLDSGPSLRNAFARVSTLAEIAKILA